MNIEYVNIEYVAGPRSRTITRSGLAFAVFLSFATSMFTGTAAAGIIEVCRTGCPYATVQSAVDVAASGDMIRIGRGKYDGPVTVTDKSLRLVGEGPDVTVLTNEGLDVGDSVVKLVCSVPGGSAITLGDLTITKGLNSQRGAGIANYGCVATIANTVVSNNQAVWGSSGNSGGGIANLNGTLWVKNSTISHNTASRKGGGVYTSGGDVIIDSSQITDNVATGGDAGGRGVYGGNGGGLAIEGGRLTVRNSVIAKNTVRAYSRYVSGVVSRHDSGRGAGIYSASSPAPQSSAVSVVGSTLKDNTAQGENGKGVEGPGGGIYNSGSLTIQGSTLKDNRAAHGGALYNESGTVESPPGTAMARESNLTANIASDGNGGGVYNAGQLTLLAATVNRNSATGTGGGVYTNEVGMTTLKNSSVVTNTASSGGGLYTEGGGKIAVTGSAVRNNVPDDCVGGGC